MNQPFVSVIIPTYNRKQFLRDTLHSLSEQTFPFSRFEVIIVDDGSTENAQDILTEEYPFKISYLQQTNQGDAIARNTGALNSTADFLVFLDDDILVSKNYLAAIVAGHADSRNRIVVGLEFLWLDEERVPMQENRGGSTSPDGQDLEGIDFTAVCSNNMSIMRESYYSVGLMQNLDFPGSSMWCDIDFSYRAFLNGFEFYRSSSAVCWHRDYVSKNLENQKRRWKEAAFRAVTLFEKYPMLVQQLPMFNDKTPIDWQVDSARTILRKLARGVAASKPFMWALENAEKHTGKRGRSGNLVQSLHRWIIGGTIYQGYREGLREKSLSSSQ